MTTVFTVRPYGRFMEIKSNFRIKKLHSANQGCKFFGRNVRVPIQFTKNIQFQQLYLIKYYNRRFLV